MVVRIVTYKAQSTDAAERWRCKRGAELSEVAGLKRVEFIRQSKPPQAGAIMYFESADDLRVYKNSARYEWLQDSIQEDWAAEADPIQDVVYRVTEAPENTASGG